MACEDAPCCGCCGLNAWYQEDLSMQESMYESLDDDFYDEFESYDDDDEDRQVVNSTSQGRPFDESDYIADRIEAKDTEYRGWS